MKMIYFSMLLRIYYTNCQTERESNLIQLISADSAINCTRSVVLFWSGIKADDTKTAFGDVSKARRVAIPLRLRVKLTRSCHIRSTRALDLLDVLELLLGK